MDNHQFRQVRRAVIAVQSSIQTRQACAVKMIDEILMTFPEEHLQKVLVEKCIIGRLLLTLACVKYKETQKNSALALSTLAIRIPSGLKIRIVTCDYLKFLSNACDN